MALPREIVDVEIDLIRRRHVSLLESAREAPSTWELHAGTLHWYVILRDVVEPDIDLEILEDIIIVRATVGSTLHHSVLPIPAACRADRPTIRFSAGTLDVRLIVRTS